VDGLDLAFSDILAYVSRADCILPPYRAQAINLLFPSQQAFEEMGEES
jgi:hypothetical protein